MEEIVRRLRNRDQKRISALKESLPVKPINEVEGDEEDISTEEEQEEDLFPAEDEEQGDTVVDSEEEIPEEDDNPDTLEDPSDEEEKKDHVNPLDNEYAVNYKIGQQVILTYSNGSKTKLAGTIDGYDKEGFYRIKWSNGKTTSGITDIALADLVEDTNESKCVCGSDHFINEGKKIVCDVCGRVIKEGKDEKIRATHHAMSTSIPECDSPKKSIKDTIRSAFKKKSPINEMDDEDYEDLFAKLRNHLDREFWTRLPELVNDIKELGYDVDEANEEYVVVSTENDEGDTESLLVPVGGTSRTITLDFERSRKA